MEQNLHQYCFLDSQNLREAAGGWSAARCKRAVWAAASNALCHAARSPLCVDEAGSPAAAVATSNVIAPLCFARSRDESRDLDGGRHGPTARNQGEQHVGHAPHPQHLLSLHPLFSHTMAVLHPEILYAQRSSATEEEKVCCPSPVVPSSPLLVVLTPRAVLPLPLEHHLLYNPGARHPGRALAQHRAHQDQLQGQGWRVGRAHRAQ